jgi:hypothetical protein
MDLSTAAHAYGALVGFDVRFGIIGGHFASHAPCPLYPRKPTFSSVRGMSALGQKRTFDATAQFASAGFDGIPRVMGARSA